VGADLSFTADVFLQHEIFEMRRPMVQNFAWW